MFLASFSWLRSCATVELETLLGSMARRLTNLLLENTYAICRVDIWGYGEAFDWVVGALWFGRVSSYGRGYGAEYVRR